MRTAVIVVAILGVTTPVFGEQRAPSVQNTTRFGALRPAQASDPYGQLFRARQKLSEVAQEQSAEPLLQPKVVCGMLVIPADPKVDPKMAAPPNKAPDLEFKIRAMEPPVCKG